MKKSQIIIKGARENNLQIDKLCIPRNKLVVFTGVSGSGKSSLAFDTLYAEGQRRYVESLSSYARQFLGQMKKPVFEKISGLSPTIAIEQKAASSNPRSTVGTITEIYDYLRVLWARAGKQHCHICKREVEVTTPAGIVKIVGKYPYGSKINILSELYRERKGTFTDVMENIREQGFVRMVVDGQIVRLDENFPKLNKNIKHSLSVVVDRIVVGKTKISRINDSVETALGLSSQIILQTDKKKHRISAEHQCPDCGIGYPELSPQSFSFNSPLGACELCNGLGTRLEMSEEILVPDPEKSISEGAIEPWSGLLQKDSWNARIFKALEDKFGVDLDMPWNKLSKKHKQLVLYGAGHTRLRVNWERGGEGGSWSMKFEGVINTMMRRMHQTRSVQMREFYSKYLKNKPCSRCRGARLKPQSSAVLLAGKSIIEISGMTVQRACNWFDKLNSTGENKKVIVELAKEIKSRLDFLVNVGLDYLTLDRPGPSLSGGEAQRIRLASQLGSELTGIMYILDEPSIGLHPKDGGRLLDALAGLRDLGNSVIIVEHDRETMERADCIVDFGPGAGSRGGRIISMGSAKKLKKDTNSITGKYLSGKKTIDVPQKTRKKTGTIRLTGATLNNLKNVDIEIHLGILTVVTGVSGAGKSSLISQTFLPALQNKLHKSHVKCGHYAALKGIKQIGKVIHINQKPIGRTPRSNPATYTKLFDEIRLVMSKTRLARARGYKPGRFSFNVKGGRCEACSGAGVIRVEMHFLADVHIPCETCRGRRYNDSTLDVKFKGQSIFDILETTVSDSLEFFKSFSKILRILRTLDDVGMGYVKLGQPATTLSGGEAQRIKLSKELAKIQSGRTFYVLDEPTTGLHFEDIKKLLSVLSRLVDSGNTVVVIEHNLDVIKCADWIIDMGPGGGEKGGKIIARGTPILITKRKSSDTGKFLKQVLFASHT